MDPRVRAVPAALVALLALSLVYRWFGWGGVSSLVTTGLAVLPRYLRAVATAAPPAHRARDDGAYAKPQ